MADPHNACSPSTGQCFGGTLTYEKTVGRTFQPRDANTQDLLENPNSPVVRDCMALCSQADRGCRGFVLGQ